MLQRKLKLNLIIKISIIIFISISLMFIVEFIAEATLYSTGHLRTVVFQPNIPTQQTPHYLQENRIRYEAFQKKYPDLPFDVVVALVNANVDFDWYEYIQEVKDPYCYLSLVNKNFSLPKDFTPSDLVQVNGGGTLREKASESYINMRDDAKKENLTLVLRSSFRNYYSQVQSFNDIAVARGYTAALRQVAKAGHSEHQLGLSIDVFHKRYEGGLSSHMRFEDTKEFKWMIQNAHKYGFILRYPENMIDIHGYTYEPWHWRYIGVGAATVMFDKGIMTFEEYYGRYLDPRIHR